MKKYALYILFIMFIPTIAYGQSQYQDAQLFLSNVGFGAISSGIGAIINKSKKEKWGRRFLKGISQGALGGCVTYLGKKATYLIYENQALGYAWPAHILHAAGYSIIENAAQAKPFLQNWNFELGPVRFDYAFHQPHPLRTRLLPIIFLNIADAKDVGGKFDPKTSLLMGQLVYKTNALIGPHDFVGISYGRTVVYANFYGTIYEVLAHETVHNFQFQEYQVINNYSTPLTNKIKNKVIRKIFTNYVYADIAYFWYAYDLQGYHGQDYYRNYYEFEAERFASNAPVLR
ncbi:MAG: hypothetical protein P4L41_19035 [Flavipsychrobacter sp.]|nr:hypothetical protein [Flavipsychrobacter sp.]